MKKYLLILLTAIAAFGAAGDIKIDVKNSSDNAWITTVFAKQNNAIFVTSASGVPMLTTTPTFASVTDSGLTAGRLVYTGTGGLLSASDDFTYAGSTAVALSSNVTSGFQIYNTSDRTTNYERLELLFSGNQGIIRTVQGGSGAARNLQLSTTGLTFTMRTGGSTSGQFRLTGTTTTTQGNIGYLLDGVTSTATAGTNLGQSLVMTYNQSTSSASNTDVKIQRIETNLGSGTQNLIDTYAGTTGATNEWTLNNKGKITQYGAVATAGWGHPAIYAAGRVTAQSAANASIATYTVGAADGSFEVSANMNATAVTTLVTTLTCTYTDESNTARTMIFPVTQLSGSFIAAGAITGTGAWETPVMHIRCKASTAITILTSTGTFTGVTYTAEGVIKQTN